MNKKMLLQVLFISAMLFNECVGQDNSQPCDVVIGSHTAVTPLPRPDRDWWMPRHQAVLDRIAQGNVDLLMIGDSITHRWEEAGKATWDKYYASRNAVNMGFSGDRTEHVLWRVQNGEVENIRPKLAILLIGTNNSPGDRNTAEEIADGIKAIVCTLRAKLPDTKVLILAIFPQMYSDYPDAWATNDEASYLASKMADGKMIFFLDINKAFLNEEGVLTTDVMPDLLHPGEKGYQLWAEAMEPTVAKLMDETQAGLVYHWTWDSALANDLGPKTIDTAVGSIGITNLSRVGAGALRLPGAGSYLWSGGSANEIELADDTPWSMSFWLHQETRGWLAGIYGLSSGLWQDADGDLIVKMLYQDNLTFGPNTLVQIAGWHHYVITVDGTDSSNVTVYQDGSSLGPQTMADTRFILRAIGDVSTGYEFAGQLDDLRIYDHVLSQSEVDSLFLEMNKAAGLFFLLM